MIPPDTESGFDDPTKPPCPCVDCGGDQPKHASSCGYAFELAADCLPLKAAHRWHQNGGHPDDYRAPIIRMESGEEVSFSGEYQKAEEWEGQVVRRFRHPHYSCNAFCPVCQRKLLDHGLIDEGDTFHTVCPGDWILTLANGKHLPCKHDLFYLISGNLKNGG